MNVKSPSKSPKLTLPRGNLLKFGEKAYSSECSTPLKNHPKVPTKASPVPNDRRRVTPNKQSKPDQFNSKNDLIPESSELINQKTPPAEKEKTEEEKFDHIIGIEFLPRKLLELETLPLRDQLHLDCDSQFKIFQNKQRKLKAIRRKEYSDSKILDVKNETSHPAIEFLENFYFENHRKMSPEELKQFANKFASSSEHISKLEDAYLRKSRRENLLAYKKLLLAPKAIFDKKISSLPLFFQKALQGNSETPKQYQNNNKTPIRICNRNTPSSFGVKEKYHHAKDSNISQLSNDKNGEKAGKTSNEAIPNSGVKSPSDRLLEILDSKIANVVIPLLSKTSRGSVTIENEISQPLCEAPKNSTRDTDCQNLDFPANLSQLFIGKEGIVKQQSLAPILVGYDFVFPSVSCSIGIDGRKSYQAVLTNERNQVISKKDLEEDFDGNIELNLVKSTSDNKEPVLNLEICLSSKRESILQVPNSSPNYFISQTCFDDNKTISDKVGRKVVRLGQKSPNSIELTKIFPVQVGGTHYHQIVKKSFDSKAKPKAKIATIDHKGKVLSQLEFPYDLTTDSYLTKVIKEIISEDGKRSFTLLTINEKMVEVARVLVTPDIVYPKMDYSETMTILEEEVDKEGKSKVTIYKKEREGRPSVYAQKIIDINEPQVDNSSNEKRQPRFSTVRPSILMDDFCDDFLKELELQSMMKKDTVVQVISSSNSKVLLLDESSMLKEFIVGSPSDQNDHKTEHNSKFTNENHPINDQDREEMDTIKEYPEEQTLNAGATSSNNQGLKDSIRSSLAEGDLAYSMKVRSQGEPGSFDEFLSPAYQMKNTVPQIKICPERNSESNLSEKNHRMSKNAVGPKIAVFSSTGTKEPKADLKHKDIVEEAEIEVDNVSKDIEDKRSDDDHTSKSLVQKNDEVEILNEVRNANDAEVIPNESSEQNYHIKVEEEIIGDITKEEKDDPRKTENFQDDAKNDNDKVDICESKVTLDKLPELEPYPELEASLESFTE